MNINIPPHFTTEEKQLAIREGVRAVRATLITDMVKVVAGCGTACFIIWVLFSATCGLQ